MRAPASDGSPPRPLPQLPATVDAVPPLGGRSPEGESPEGEAPRDHSKKRADKRVKKGQGAHNGRHPPPPPRPPRAPFPFPPSTRFTPRRTYLEEWRCPARSPGTQTATASSTRCRSGRTRGAPPPPPPPRAGRASARRSGRTRSGGARRARRSSLLPPGGGGGLERAHRRCCRSRGRLQVGEGGERTQVGEIAAASRRACCGCGAASAGKGKEGEETGGRAGGRAGGRTGGRGRAAGQS